MHNQNELIQIKRSIFRKGIILLYAVFLSLIAYTFAPQILTPRPGEQSLRCATAHWYVGLARAAGQNCTTKCTDWKAADCNGYSSCFNKNISCVNGVDQDGRSCQGCCFDCKVVCEPDPDQPPSISGSVSCGQWGNNGWCLNNSQLRLNASDPQGYSLSITGNAGGRSISCDGDCSVDLPSGSGVATYQVTASQSGGTASGSSSWAYDPDSPNVGLDISGSNGSNSWYKSQVTITPTGSDSTSGFAGAFVSVDNGAWQSSATLNDGVHHVSVSAADKAGNTANSSTTISVDTTNPSINVNMNGSTGKNGWFVSNMSISASASDSTSGIASLEFSADGGSYQNYGSPVAFSNGHHTIRFKAVDKAGNVTESPVQNFQVDSTAPSVSLSTSGTVGDTISYKAHDDGSGLSSIRVVLEDKEGRYPKISWNENASGESAKGEFNWDGRFKDGTVAPPGQYLVWVKAIDQAGNQSTQYGSVIISEPGSSPASSQPDASQNDNPVPPEDLSETDDVTTENTPPMLTYGGSTTETESAEITNQSLSLSTDATASPANPFPWWLVVGAAATAGAATYVASKPKFSRLQLKTKARKLAELEAKWAAEAAAKELAAKVSKMDMQAKKTSRLEAEEDIKWEKTIAAQQKALKDAETKAGLEAYYNARKQGEKEAAIAAPPKEKSWWEKALHWIDTNQKLSSIGAGAIVGLAAIAITLAVVTTVTLPVVLVAAGIAAVTASVVVAAGTVALNNHYERDPWTNVTSNIKSSAITAALVTGIGLVVTGGLLTKAVVTTGNSIAAYCMYTGPDLCAKIGPLLNSLDATEQAYLQLKFGFQTLTGNQAGAQDTLFELQLEQMDGGMPGNVAAKHLADLGDDAADLIRIYGDDVLPLLVNYGDEAMDIIGAYGDEGIVILKKYGYDSIDLINDYGTPAIKVMGAVNPEAAKKLLGTLDEDVLDYTLEQGPDAIQALSLWDEKLLADKSIAIQLSLRSGKDGKVLNDVNKLINSGPIDPAKLTKEQQDLINAIAESSTHYEDSGQVVLGKWFGFDNGYAGYANDTGSINYYPHPEMWGLLGKLGKENRDEVAWLINKQAIQPMIDKGMPFEYTLNDVPNVNNEKDLIESIWQGTITDAKIMDRLGLGYVPGRMKELQTLKAEGYQILFDDIENSYLLIKP